MVFQMIAEVSVVVLKCTDSVAESRTELLNRSALQTDVKVPNRLDLDDWKLDAVTMGFEFEPLSLHRRTRSMDTSGRQHEEGKMSLSDRFNISQVTARTWLSRRPSTITDNYK